MMKWSWKLPSDSPSLITLGPKMHRYMYNRSYDTKYYNLGSNNYGLIHFLS